MEDRSHDRTIDQIAHNIFSGIDWGSPCPPREKWSWAKIWNWTKKFDKKREGSMRQSNDENEMYQHNLETENEKDIGIYVERNELPRCGYQYCDIKMQDPCEPCCCKIECIEPPPCTDIPRIHRTPKCDCEKRKKIRSGYKCCEACNVVLESA